MLDDMAFPSGPPVAGGAPTVTLFGHGDVLDHALTDELVRRGCRTHSVTVRSGWLPSASFAVVRLDTDAGALALEGLCAHDGPPAHVVALCAHPQDADHRDRLHDTCRDGGTRHDLSLIWHPPLADAGPFDTAWAASPPPMPTGELAAVVADQVLGQAVAAATA